MTPRNSTSQFNYAELAELIKNNIDQLLEPCQMQLTELSELAQQSDRALRGNNGTVGVIARVERLEIAVKELSQKFLGEDKLNAIVEEAIRKAQAESTPKDRFTLKEIFTQFISPIFISGLSIFLFTYMPKIIAMISSFEGK